MRKWGFPTPIIKSLNLRKKARPGATTVQAKLSKPANDEISLEVNLRQRRKAERRLRHLFSFSWGKWDYIRTVSSSIPAKPLVVDESNVLSGAMGIPRWLHNIKKVFNWCWHDSREGEIIKKSSTKCKIQGIWNLFRAIQSCAVENISKVLQELEKPIGMYLS